MRVGLSSSDSLHFNSEDDIDLLAVIKLAESLGVALLAFVLRIDFKLDIRGELRETIRTIRPDNVSGHRVGAGIRKVNHGIDQGIVMFVKNLAGEQAARSRFLFLVLGVEIRARGKKRYQQKYECRAKDPDFVISQAVHLRKPSSAKCQQVGSS